MRARSISSVALTLILFGTGLSVAHAAFNVPVNDGYVTDMANVLTPEQKQTLDTTLDAYKQQSSNEIAILLVQSLSGADIVQAAVDTGRSWGVGTKENNNGILILVAIADHDVTIQVGYGLEGVVPDIVAKGVIDEDITPHFKKMEYFEGLQAAVDALQKHIGGEYKPDRYTKSALDGVFPFVVFFFFFILNFCSAWLARNRSFWAGGVMGGVFGLLLLWICGWYLTIPFFVIMGLGFDYWVSRYPQATRWRRGGRGGPWGGMGGGMGGTGGGGFGGFGGGSFGGGGASGKW